VKKGVGQAPGRGRQAIRDAFAGKAANGSGASGPNRKNVRNSVTRPPKWPGSRPSASGVLNPGYYRILWKRQPDGTWKMHWDIISSSQSGKA
jgi:hypothetical protein